MEFLVDKQALLAELGLLQGVVEKKGTIPILSNILIESEPAPPQIRLTATDLEITAQTSVSAHSASAGATTLPARKLFDIVRSLPEGEISFLEEGEKWVRVSGGGARFRIAAGSREHFPSFVYPKDFQVATDAPPLCQSISRIIFAISHEETRYSINGALFDLSGGRLKMVATDGHRLAICEQLLPGATESFKVIVPRKALAACLRCFAAAADIEISTDENHIFFRSGQRLLAARQVAGSFPNYEAVIPPQYERHAKLKSEVAAGALRRIAIMADDRSRAVKLEFEPGRLTVSSSTTDLGEATEVIEIIYEAASTQIGFNVEYLLDFLAAAQAEDVTIYFKDGSSPVLFEPALADSNYKYVVMPMRL
jgi:DNA polymerase-3 subunit beta